MCVGFAGKVVIINHENRTALVDFFGVPRWVGITLVPHLEVEDYVLVLGGYVLERIDLKEAEERINIWEEILEEKEGN